MADSNPHTQKAGPVVEVLLGPDTIGFLTPKMTERHGSQIEGTYAGGKTPTAYATVEPGSKGGKGILRVKAIMRKLDA